MTIDFRPLEAADLPTLEAWFARPHARPWWGEPAAERAEIERCLGEAGFGPFIVLVDGREAGYIQWWRPDGAWTIPLAAPEETTRGIDLTLAEEADCGRGIGRRVIEAFVSRLAAEGVRRVLIDPHPDNYRARRAYAAAGFREASTGARQDGPYVLMVRDIDEKVHP